MREKRRTYKQLTPEQKTEIVLEGIRADLWWGSGGPQGSRREFLSMAGGGLLAAAVLAACGGSESSTGSSPTISGYGVSGTGSSPTISASGAADLFAGDPSGKVNFANMTLYIDQAQDASGKVYNPSLRAFTKETGIEVRYQEVINDTAQFAAQIQSQLASGEYTGYDVIMTSRQALADQVQNDWLVPLDTAQRPNFTANAATWAKNPAWDDGNVHTMPWAGGFTGVAWNRDRVDGPLTLDDLANPDKVGTSSVDMNPSEMPEFVMVNLGIDIASSGPKEWQAAADWLMHQRDSGTVRGYYGGEYLADLTAGNLAAAMAWSGDITYASIWGGAPQLTFDFPTDGGGILWADNMAIPVGVEHPVDALELMDFYYRPEIAKLVFEWVFSLSPVDGVRELILGDATKAKSEGNTAYAKALEETARDPYSFPSNDVVAATQSFKTFENSDEQDTWDNIFFPISQGR